MHSFHQSRGRILFDAFCALAVASASVVAWMQTGASALLALAGVATVYALVHATDRPRREIAVAPRQEAAPAPPAPAAEVLPDAEPKAPKAKPRSRKKKAEPAPVVPVIAEAVDVPEVEEIVIGEPAHAEDESEADNPWHPGHIEPLFEPQPALRQQRTIFGRKSG
jgi:hypothetical protein